MLRGLARFQEISIPLLCGESPCSPRFSLCEVSVEECLGLGLKLRRHEELQGMHQPLPILHDRRYLGCGVVLRGPLMPGMATGVPVTTIELANG